MNADVSRKTVGGGFSLKALIFKKKQNEKARTVAKQLENSCEELEVFRRYSPKDPPMIAQDMPDYHAFCSGYYQHCEHCPHYVNSGTGLFCSMWEAVYPGVVRWYPA